MSDYYPAGTPGPRPTEVELVCINPDCHLFGDVVEVPAIDDLGGIWLNNDDDHQCECGWDREDAPTQRYVLTLTPERRYAIISIHQQELVAISRIGVSRQAYQEYTQWTKMLNNKGHH